MLPERLQKLIGKAGEPMIMEIEKGAIKKYADAVGELNPLYWDEEYARNSRYGSLIAPPGFFGWPVKWQGAMPFFPQIRAELVDALTAAGFGRLLDGGIEYEFFYPVRPGDILVSIMKIAEIYERESKGGTLVFSVTETSYTNQNGALVAIARQTLISR